MNEGKLSERQSKFSEIASALRGAEGSCSHLEDALDILQGSNEPVSDKAPTTDKCFVEVYSDISARVRRIEERIRSATDRMQEMLV